MRSNKTAVISVAGILAGFVVVLIWGIGIARAEDLSTWRYGSPGDVRRYGSQIMQQPDYHVQYHNGYPVYVRNEAKAEYMDMMFRAGSPELYRQTQPQAPQTNININVYNSNEAPQYIIAPNREHKTGPLGRKPNYPAALMP